jgi:DNA polymerase III delta prime subunit
MSNESNIDLYQQLHQQLKSQTNHGLNHFINTLSPLIITGYQGLPILEVAKFLAKSKICSSSEPPCLKCLKCEAVDNESSIHLKVIKPEGKAIKVDQIREVIDFLSFKRDQVTVIIFDNAHLMNLQAANALLKTLEEPPENCWILLTSPSIKNMLSTIRSRCLVYKSRPLNLQSFTDLDEDVQNQQEILQGRWDWLLKSEEILDSIQEVRAWLARFKEAHLQNEEIQYLDWMKGREGLQELIMYLRLLAKAELKQRFVGQDLATTSFNSVGWTGLIDRLQNLEIALNSNVDTKLIEDHLLDAIKESHVFH